MPNKLDRASQFMPFDALSGFYDSIHIVEKEKQNKRSLCSDYLEEIEKKLNKLKVGDMVFVSYYHLTEYIETTGILKKIDFVYKKIFVGDSIIDLDDVFIIRET